MLWLGFIYHPIVLSESWTHCPDWSSLKNKCIL